MNIPKQFLEVQQTFDKIIAHSQGFVPNTTAIFKDWYENKREYIEWFGGSLICEIGPVEFHIDKEKQINMVNDFIDQCGHIMLYNEYSNFYQFIKANKESFFQNLVSNEFANFNKPIKKGMKLSKAFKFFIQDKDTLTRIQQLASTYIQKDKITGILCFSVHPLDYISASETTYNWRSCHSLDGEYRAGNLSYMTDNSTICCYIRGEEFKVLPDFPNDILWNSKKWRMWIHLAEHWRHVFLGRQYPFTLDGIPEEIRSLLPGEWDPFTDFHFSVMRDNNNNQFHLKDKVIILNNGEGYQPYNERDVIKDGSKLHYNDLLYSSYYEPYYTSRTWYDHIESPKIVIGHKVKCLNCGKHDIEPAAGLMVCSKCAEKLGLAEYGICCEVCGEYVNEEDIIYLHDGTAVCRTCIDNGGYHWCESCEEYFSEDDMCYSEKYNEWYCSDCFQEIYDEEMEYRRQNGFFD